MKIHLTLVTIVSEGILKDKLIALLRSHGATGFTITRAEGEGSRGVRARDWEGPNLKFECVIAAEAADMIVEELGDDYFEDYAVVAWLTDVTVLRGRKFSTEGNPGTGQSK